MRKDMQDFRSNCEAAVMEFLDTCTQSFYSRDQIARATGVNGRALDRVLQRLCQISGNDASTQMLAKFSLFIENGRAAEVNVYGVMPRALSFRRLNAVRDAAGGYALSESSSDDVACYIAKMDLRARQEPEPVPASTFTEIAAALFPGFIAQLSQRMDMRLR